MRKKKGTEGEREVVERDVGSQGGREDGKGRKKRLMQQGKKDSGIKQGHKKGGVRQRKRNGR